MVGTFAVYGQMPKKVRELKAMLRRAGFVCRPGKGGHTVWEHPLLSSGVSISGKDGNDAQIYQEKDVRRILQELREVQGE
jgi:predicted RNA binding protein YcfA (HicA-like mRNA interferase family)